MYFLALSQAPPVLDMEIANWTPDNKAPEVGGRGDGRGWERGEWWCGRGIGVEWDDLQMSDGVDEV